MTRDEIAITALRFQRMHEYFKHLIDTDPKNAPFYEIFVDHYRHQSLALNRDLEEMKVQNSKGGY
jgi:hypothetical protein